MGNSRQKFHKIIENHFPRESDKTQIKLPLHLQKSANQRSPDPVTKTKWTNEDQAQE